MRKDINILFEKDPKFIDYIHIYLWRRIQIYLEEKQDEFKRDLKSIKNKINNYNLLLLKLEEIRKIIFSYKLYNFDIKAHFKEFSDNYEIIQPIKKKKVSEKEIVKQNITDFQIFQQKLKNYLGNIDENIELFYEEPGQFVFQLFLEKIGLIWS